MAVSAGERGVHVIQADSNEVSGEYDVLLFTRSLHHAENLDNTLAHAVTLLALGNRSSSKNSPGTGESHRRPLFYDNRAKLVAAGLLDAPRSRRHRCDHDEHEHPVASRRRTRRSVDRTHHWGRRRADRPCVEDGRIAAGDLPSVGLLASVCPQSNSYGTPNGQILIVSSVARMANGQRHDALTMTTLPIDPGPAPSVSVADRRSGRRQTSSICCAQRRRDLSVATMGAQVRDL